MKEKLKAADLIQMLVALLRSKEQICGVLQRVDAEGFASGILGIHQDIFNDSLKSLILGGMQAEEFDIRFSADSVRVTVDKYIKAMMLEKVVRIKLKFHNIDLIFKNGQHFLTVDYMTEFEGIPPIIERMPGGNAIKDMIINTFIKYKIKDADWIDIKGDRIYADFSRMPAFAKLEQSGIFGVDIVNEVELEFLGTNNGELQFGFKTK